MDQVEKKGKVVTVTRDGIKVQRTYADPETARRAARRLEKSRDARDEFLTRKSR
jgi:hypothetical protein